MNGERRKESRRWVSTPPELELLPTAASPSKELRATGEPTLLEKDGLTTEPSSSERVPASSLSRCRIIRVFTLIEPRSKL